MIGRYAFRSKWFAIFAAIRSTSSFVSSLAAERRPGLALIIDIAQHLTVASRTMKQFGATFGGSGRWKRRAVTLVPYATALLA